MGSEMSRRRRIAAAGGLLLAVLAAALPGCGGDGSDAGPLPQVHPSEHVLPEWFVDAKFGIFIHWGVYSVPAWAPVGRYAEWYWYYQQIAAFFPHYRYHLETYGPNVRYDDFIPEFRAENWDPADWIDLIRDSGAKYWVLTTKHHDGFALWPTTVSGRNSVELGPRRDIVGELIEANRGSGLEAGLYYSLPEWFNPAPKPAGIYEGGNRLFEQFPHPQDPYVDGNPEIPYVGYTPVDDYAEGIVVPQILDLIDRYEPAILWCDIGGDPEYFQTQRWLTHFYTQAQRYAPDGVVANDRCGAYGDFVTPEYAPIPEPGGPYFESTRGIGFSFGYNRNEELDDYLSDAEVIHTLIDNVAAGGNLLLNVGPEADGTIPQVMRDRLLAIGRWLATNGEAIYGSRPAERPGAGSLRFTVGEDGSFYVIAKEWPGESLVVDDAPDFGPDAEIVLLGADGTPLDYGYDENALVVPLAAAPAASVATDSEHAFVFRVRNIGNSAERSEEFGDAYREESGADQRDAACDSRRVGIATATENRIRIRSNGGEP